MTDLSNHPTQLASAWLADFAAALERGDVDAAVALFDDDCYWRDLVSFTWNIKTHGGPRRDPRDARAPGWPTSSRAALAVEGEATEAGGVTEAWFTLRDRASARGTGHLRLRGRQVPGRCSRR